MVCLCVFCGKNLSRPSRLKSHIETYHSDCKKVVPKKFVKCHYCNKQLSSPQALGRHKIRYHYDTEEDKSAQSSRYHKEEKTSPTTREETLSTKVEELVSTSNQIADSETMEIEDNGEWTSSDNSSSDYYRNTPRDEAFDFILQETYNKFKDRKNIPHEEVKRMFRHLYKEYVLFFRKLRKSKTHKRIMATVNGVRLMYDDFDFEEALVEGVRLRRKLFDDLVPEEESDEEKDK